MDKYIVKMLSRAKTDLDRLYFYLATEHSEQEIAQNLVASIESAILSLEYLPYRCSVRRIGQYATKGYRQLFVKNFTILYRIDEASKTVVVVTVRYSRSQF